MNFAFDEDVELLRSTVRKFVEQELLPAEDFTEEHDRIPDAIMAKAKDMGLFGLSIAEEFGGQKVGMVTKCVIFEELGKGILGFASILGVHNNLGGPMISNWASEETKRRLLPAMAQGDKIAAFGLTEPSAGSDAANLKTKAVREGDTWVINGVKHFITNAPIADVFVVMARTDGGSGARGISAFLVERGTPGFVIGAIDRKMGHHGARSGELVLTDCRVPKGNLLGREGEGYIGALKVLTNARACLGARAVGTAQRLLDMSIRYTKDRVQFGKPIGENQGIQWMLAESATEIAAARALTYQTAWMVDQGMNVIQEAAQVKLFSSEMVGRVADRTVQIFGGMGYMKELPVERIYRDVRLLRIFEGTSEVQKMVIARKLLG
jgi:acyl-CoA dehydrogenase